VVKQLAKKTSKSEGFEILRKKVPRTIRGGGIRGGEKGRPGNRVNTRIKIYILKLDPSTLQLGKKALSKRREEKKTRPVLDGLLKEKRHKSMLRGN